jgi:toxin YoeB
MKRVFSSAARQDYRFWQGQATPMRSTIDALLDAIERAPFAGAGAPTPLTHDLTGYWSRRLSAGHRIVYKVEGELLLIAQLRRHY